MFADFTSSSEVYTSYGDFEIFSKIYPVSTCFRVCIGIIYNQSTENSQSKESEDQARLD